ncbi:MAG: cysteine dioxygenase [Solirubrobacteraceae bacterium]
MSLSLPELEPFAAELAASPRRWRHLVRHDDTRIYEQISDRENVNAWLICWSEDSDTGFHGHDVSGAGIAVVAGRVREDLLTVTGGAVSRELGAGTTFKVPATRIHRALHAGEGPAVTIHAYSPPLRRMGSCRVGANGVLERESQHFEQQLRGEPALV